MNDRSTTIVALSAVLGFLATLAVVLRFVARHVKHQKFGVDDILIIVALVLALGVVTIDIVAATWSRVGEHEIFYKSGPEKGYPLEWEIKRESITLFSIEILHTCAMPAIKIYTLAFYLRIFVSKTFRIAVYVVGAYVVCWWLAVLFATIFQCKPVGPVVDVDAKCFNALVFLQAAAVTNLASDVAVVVLPMPVVMKLQMPTEHRIALVGIFLTSSLVIVAGIGRTVSYFNVSKDLDFSYHDYYLVIWTSIEPCMGVIGACLPSCRPAFRGLSPESLIGSLRSVFSLRSIGSKDNTRQGSKTERWQELRDDLNNGDYDRSFEISQNRSESSIYPGQIKVQKKFELGERNRTAEV